MITAAITIAILITAALGYVAIAGFAFRRIRARSLRPDAIDLGRSHDEFVAMCWLVFGLTWLVSRPFVTVFRWAGRR